MGVGAAGPEAVGGAGRGSRLLRGGAGPGQRGAPPGLWPREPAVVGGGRPLCGVLGSELPRAPASFSPGGPGGIASCACARAFPRLPAEGPFRPCWMPFGLGLRSQLSERSLKIAFLLRMAVPHRELFLEGNVWGQKRPPSPVGGHLVATRLAREPSCVPCFLACIFFGIEDVVT